MLKTDYVISGDIEVNCYFVYDDATKRAIVIDPGQDSEKVIDKITELNLKPELLINTHGHFDHIFSDDIIRTKYNVPLAIHKNDSEMLSDPLKNASVMIGIPARIKAAEILFDAETEFETGFCRYSIINTPGHTAGSVSILINNLLFSGDTLFCGSIGRTDLPTGDDRDMKNSLNKLKKLDENTVLYPGHGIFSSIGKELSTNMFLK